jgi:amino acid transporter
VKIAAATIFGTIALIYVRATSAVDVQLYTTWWWAWIIGTVLMAGFAGAFVTLAYLRRTGRICNGTNKTTAD